MSCGFEKVIKFFWINCWDLDNFKGIEVKSGKDYRIHSALNKFLSIEEYNIKRAYVLSNAQKVYTQKGITYIPIYYVMFFNNESHEVGILA